MQTAIKYFSRGFAAILVICAATTVRAQSDTVRLLNELMKLEGFHTQTEFLRFETDYYYREVDDTVEVKDTMGFEYMVSFDKFRISTNSALMIQNNDYRMSFYVTDSMVMIEQPTQIFRRLFDLDLYDEQMREVNIGSIQITDSANIRRLSLTGLAGSGLQSYNLYFDTTNNHITRIQYNLRKQVYNTGSPFANPDLISVTIIFNNYSQGSYDDTQFDTEPFFVRQGGVYKPGSVCGPCEIIDLTNQE
jgi:hypothetical protein